MSAIALAMFVIELQIPSLTTIPAVKLGLANIVTLFLLFLGGEWKIRDICAVLAVRIALGAFVTGQLMSLVFSGIGGVVALVFMLLSKKLFGEKLLPMVSVFGGIGHNIGQITAACFVYGSASVLYYLPVLLFSGIISGLLTGFCVYSLYKSHPKFIGFLRRSENVR